MNFCWHSYFGYGYDEVRCSTDIAVLEEAPDTDTVILENIYFLYILFCLGGRQIITLKNLDFFSYICKKIHTIAFSSWS